MIYYESEELSPYLPYIIMIWFLRFVINAHTYSVIIRGKNQAFPRHIDRIFTKFKCSHFITYIFENAFTKMWANLLNASRKDKLSPRNYVPLMFRSPSDCISVAIDFKNDHSKGYGGSVLKPNHLLWSKGWPKLFSKPSFIIPDFWF
jgi:hypothetical protein